jgi:hypothetical protein
VWQVGGFLLFPAPLKLTATITEREQYPVISVKYYEICMCGFSNRIGGVMVSVLAASAVNRGFETRSGKTNYYEICICAEHANHYTTDVV